MNKTEDREKTEQDLTPRNIPSVMGHFLHGGPSPAFHPFPVVTSYHESVHWIKTLVIELFLKTITDTPELYFNNSLDTYQSNQVDGQDWPSLAFIVPTRRCCAGCHEETSSNLAPLNHSNDQSGKTMGAVLAQMSGVTTCFPLHRTKHAWYCKSDQIFTFG